MIGKKNQFRLFFHMAQSINMLLSLDFCVPIVHDGQKDRGMNAATSSVIENIRDFPSPLYWPLSDNVTYMPCVMLNEGLNVQQNEDFGTCLDNFLSTTNNRDNVFFPIMYLL